METALARALAYNHPPLPHFQRPKPQLDLLLFSSFPARPTASLSSPLLLILYNSSISTHVMSAIYSSAVLNIKRGKQIFQNFSP